MKNVELVDALIHIVELKDLYTQGHSHHVNVIVKAIYNCLPKKHQEKLDEEKLLTAALLHDVGKILTPDNVLNKEGALDDTEWNIMKQHPLNGKRLLEKTSFSDISDWILYHHERMDGRGYYGLPCSKIPLESRIIAIGDTFSALRTYRIYRPAKSITETICILQESAGTQLDEDILTCFLALDINTLTQLECNCEICKQRRKAAELKIAN